MDQIDVILELVLSIFLMFSNDVVLVPLIVSGFIWFDRHIFYHAACILLFSMIINFSLKLTFHLLFLWMIGSNDLSFPSGHMFSSTAFYGWLAYCIPSMLLRSSVIILLGGIGCGLIYNDYHGYSDILGSILFALFLFIQYIKYLPKWFWPIKNIMLILSTVLLLYIQLFHGVIPQFIWMAYYSLWGFILGEVYFVTFTAQTFYSKGMATIAGGGLIVLCYLAGEFILHPIFPPYIAQIVWLGIAISPSLACYLQEKLSQCIYSPR